ncbi:MAG: ComEC/Rec2 family competence protein [bacterium]|nr:ComEC/Rec2 family competence protein [bacterium]
MPYSKILFISCLCFIGSIFIISSFWLSPENGGQTPKKTGAQVLGGSVPRSLKEKFREVINSNLKQPEASILSGILLGDKLNISQEWKQKMANTGTSHIVAVSGMNIVMLAQILVVLGVTLGLYRGQALWFSLILIWLFIALIGFQVSAVRAGIMGSILIVCQLLGRQNASFRALVLAVSLMLAIDPTLLRYSLSFQLSVLATLGLIHLGPAIKRKVHYEIISTTLSAQIFTIPLLIYSFGYVSLVGLPVNLLVVPLIPAVMILGIVFLIFGLFNGVLAAILAWPVSILLSLMVWLIDIFSKIPFAILRF